MNRTLALLLAALVLQLTGTPVLAQPESYQVQRGARVLTTTSWVEEWDPVAGRWVQVEDKPPATGFAVQKAANTNSCMVPVARSGDVTITETVRDEQVRFVGFSEPRLGSVTGISQFGPFRVLDGKRAAIVGATDAASPAAFRAMIAAHPGLEVIEFRDAPGTSNDIANLAVGRLIRAAGLATHVPEGGSARSGAVELFLAGTRRSMDPGALFAVHSWRDQTGREPADFAPDAPENRLYLDYYAEMGMSPEEARAFYAMTNSVPHHSALWLRGREMARWVAPVADPVTAPRRRVVPALPPPAPVLLAAAPAGTALGEHLRASPTLGLALASGQFAVPPLTAPRLAYADLGAMPLALLDSAHAFP